MSAGSPGDDAQPAPSSEPAQPPSDPVGFASPAPAEWSTPAEWTPPTPQPWLTPDNRAAQHPTGNGFSPADGDPWPAQPAADPSANQSGAPATGQDRYSPAYSPAAPRTNPLSIAALVCGLAQFFLGLFALNFLLAIPAIICGAIGLRQTRVRAEGGRGLSIAGLVLGILGIVWNVVYVVLIIYLGAHFRPTRG